MAVKCSCGYVNHNPDARSCELCHAKLKPAGGASAAAEVADPGDDLANEAAAAGAEEQTRPKGASSKAPARPGPTVEVAPPRAGRRAAGSTAGLDALLFVLSFPVTFPAALFVLLKSHDWTGVPVTVWIGQALLALTAALGVAMSAGPGSAPWLVAVLPLTLLSSLAGALLLVRVGEAGPGWLSVTGVLVASCAGTGVLLSSRVGSVFEGHAAPVRAIDLSRDGKQLATVAEDGALRLFDVESRRLLRTDPAHVPVATGVRIDASGKHAITAGSDGFTTIWDLGGGAAPVRIEAHRGGVTDVDVAAAPDSTTVRILTSGVDGAVRVWAPDGSELGSLLEHKGAVTTAAWSPDGERVASGGTDGAVHVWTPGSRSRSFEKHKGPVICLAWSPDGNLVVSGGEDRLIVVWDVSDERKPPRVLGGTAAVRALAVLPGGKRLVSAHDSRALVLWDLGRDVPVGELALPAVATSIATSKDGAQLFVSAGRTVRVLEVQDGFSAP